MNVNLRYLIAIWVMMGLVDLVIIMFILTGIRLLRVIKKRRLLRQRRSKGQPRENLFK